MITGKQKINLATSQDYEDLFKTLNAFSIKYLVAGAYAVIHYTAPRFTKDIDIWVIPDINDAEIVYQALKEFGAPLEKVKPQNFKNKNLIYQIGVAPIRIDILMDIPGVSYEQAWKNKKRIRYGQTPVYILGLQDLIRAKKKAGRPQDTLDLKNLLQIKKISAKKI